VSEPSIIVNGSYWNTCKLVFTINPYMGTRTSINVNAASRLLELS